ncbi:MAG TPA: hypothetical protein DCE41_19720 [Cytophagales bacterium]|nr:hypothetical protein [Cytophagales bacterium]HAA19281.1 hypothetical protein [Cytophagales bacterium]HAP61671.1 hypothetical protein [Cytophagales bacterium]
MIVLTKGPIRSTLTNLDTLEVRHMPTAQVPEDMEEDGWVASQANPTHGDCTIELLDVYLEYPGNLEQWRSAWAHIDSINNIRLIYRQQDIPLSLVADIVASFHATVMHFGLCILDFTETREEEWRKVIPNTKIVKGAPHRVEEGYHVPTIWPLGDQFNLSHEHNAYHRDRSSLSLNEDGAQMVSHAEYDIPKDDIKVCQDCELRRLCYDHRIPEATDEGWAYPTECAYDPYTATWHVAEPEPTQ